jgi:hypothetical protein
MNLRRLACLLLGAWLATGAILALITLQNRRLIDSSLLHLSPSVAAQVKTIGPEQARLLLLLQWNEQTRFYMDAWGTAQLAAAAACLLVVLFATREGKTTLLLAGGMLLAIGVQRLWLIPEIATLGRLIEVMPGAAAEGRLETIRLLYYAIETLKIAVGVVVGVRLLRQKASRSGHARKQVDVVDKPDYGHVNR